MFIANNGLVISFEMNMQGVKCLFKFLPDIAPQLAGNSNPPSLINRLRNLKYERDLSTERVPFITEQLTNDDFTVEVTIAVIRYESTANANHQMSRIELIRYVNSTPLLDYFGESHTCSLSRSNAF